MPLFGKTPKESKHPTGQRPQFPGIGPRQEPKPVQKPMPKSSSSPKTLFEEKKDWSRYDLKRRIDKTSTRMPDSTRKKMLDEALPQKRFQSYISEGEAKTRLRELRSQERQAKTYGEKTKLSRQRQFLEGETGLKGKY